MKGSIHDLLKVVFILQKMWVTHAPRTSQSMEKMEDGVMEICIFCCELRGEKLSCCDEVKYEDVSEEEYEWIEENEYDIYALINKREAFESWKQSKA